MRLAAVEPRETEAGAAGEARCCLHGSYHRSGGKGGVAQRWTGSKPPSGVRRAGCPLGVLQVLPDGRSALLCSADSPSQTLLVFTILK